MDSMQYLKVLAFGSSLQNQQQIFAANRIACMLPQYPIQSVTSLKSVRYLHISVQL